MRIGSRTEIREKAEHILADVGLADERYALAGILSRGDQRRFELAMCLVQDPKLLLLDEPTAGMSRADTNGTIGLLQRIGERRITKVGKTSTLRTLADPELRRGEIWLRDAALHAMAAWQAARAITLDMGEVVFDGTAREVIDNVELRHEYLAI